MYEKENAKTKKLVKIIRGKCDICGRNKSQIFTKLMTRAENLFTKGKCKNNHCSSMSNSAWCDLNSKSDIIKLHDKCPNPKCKYQKIITFAPHQYMLEGESIKSKLQNFFRGRRTTWDKFFKPAINTASPYIGMAVSAKTQNPQIGKATSDILKTISGGKILSLTDMHGRDLRKKVM